MLRQSRQPSINDQLNHAIPAPDPQPPLRHSVLRPAGELASLWSRAIMNARFARHVPRPPLAPTALTNITALLS